MKRALWVLPLILLFGMNRPAEATPIIDQQCCGSQLYDLFPFFLANLTRVQTFTVGMGGLMTGIDVGLSPETPLPTFELFEGAFTAGQSTAGFGAPLVVLSPVDSGVTVPSSGSFPGHFFFSSLGAGIPVVAGQQFSIVQTGEASGGWLGTNDLYIRGQALVTFFGDDTLHNVNEDLVFRSYVDASVAEVPEPASMVLLGTGLIGIGARRSPNRRRRG